MSGKFLGQFRDFFSQSEFMPHGHCYLWNPSLVWSHVVSDISIGLAYLAISLTLYALIKKIRLRFSAVVLCFGLFIGACGLAHFMEVWTLWHPDYWVSALVKVITAVASVFTGIYLFRLRHEIVGLAESARLSDERKIELERLNVDLEDRVKMTVLKLTQGQFEIEAAFNQDVIGMAQVDLHTQKFIQANPKLLRLLGFSESELMNIGPFQITHEEDRDVDAENLRQLRAEEIKSFQREKRFVRKDGSFFWAHILVSGIKNPEGKIVRTIAIINDITEKKEIYAQFKKTEMQFGTLANSIPQLAWMTDATGYIIWYNQRWYDFTGTTLSEMQGWGWQKVHHPEHSERVTAKWLKHLQSGEDWEDTFPLRSKAGEYRWFLSRATAARDDSGAIQHWFGTNTDITDQLNTENELIKSKAKLAESERRNVLLIESLPQLVWTCLPNGEANYLSPQWVDYTGTSEEQQLGLKWLEEVIHPDDRARTYEHWMGAVKGLHPYDIEYRIRGKDQNYRWFKTRGVPVQSAEGVTIFWFGTCTDVHEQRLLIQKLESATARLTVATSAAEIGIWEWDIPNNLINVSNIEQEMLHLPAETVNFQDFKKRFLPEDREDVQTAINDAVTNKTDFIVEFRTMKPAGNLAWIYGRGRAVYDEQDKAVRMYGVNIDITERKKTEERLHQAVKLANEANKLKSAFLANMSHEIRTPLGAILGFNDLLRDSTLGFQERESFHSIIKRNGEQLSNLINDILDLSKVEAGQFRTEIAPTEVRKLVAEICSSMQVRACEKNIRLSCHTEDSVPALIGTDAFRLSQVLMNIIGNAIKFTHIGSVGMIATAENEMIRFLVTDTGIGISEEQMENLFKPFTQADPSTTRKYGGTGLGLILSRRFAEALGGSLTLKSSIQGQGTVFELTIRNDLPALAHFAAPVSNMSSEQSEDIPLKKHELLKSVKILIVDDSPDNRHLISRIVIKEGAQVSTAENGIEAIDAAFKNDPDIILIDLQMPVMDGYTATEKLREGGFMKPIIALSAHAMSEVRAKTLNVGCDDYMAKPIKADELVLKLERYTSHNELSSRL